MLIVTGYRRDAEGDYEAVTSRRVRDEQEAAELALKWADYYTVVGVRPDGAASVAHLLREDEDVNLEWEREEEDI